MHGFGQLQTPMLFRGLELVGFSPITQSVYYYYRSVFEQEQELVDRRGKSTLPLWSHHNMPNLFDDVNVSPTSPQRRSPSNPDTFKFVVVQFRHNEFAGYCRNRGDITKQVVPLVPVPLFPLKIIGYMQSYPKQTTCKTDRFSEIQKNSKSLKEKT